LQRCVLHLDQVDDVAELQLLDVLLLHLVPAGYPNRAPQHSSRWLPLGPQGRRPPAWARRRKAANSALCRPCPPNPSPCHSSRNSRRTNRPVLTVEETHVRA
jgi:hypothetical protein